MAHPEHELPKGDFAPNELRVGAELAELIFHARGGLGSVYSATERNLHRRVAVKFILHKLVDDRESCDRFLQEAEVTARLEHPGVVPLYGIGSADNGQLFYYMRFIDGVTLDQAIKEHFVADDLTLREAGVDLEFRRLLNSFVSVCKTIAYAHNRGIVHRDIKPQNVMLGRFGETIVVDWGLAVPVVRDDRFRASGEATLKPQSPSPSDASSRTPAGTPSYMSPEQLSGLVPTPSTDIYSLGATLYKILTGEPPFRHPNPHELKQMVLEGRVIRPRSLRRSVPYALEAICLKAMSSQPALRYDTALDLAQDIENFLADAPVRAYSEPVTSRIARWSRRNRTATHIAFAAMLGILVISGLASVWLGRLAQQEQIAREIAERERGAADQARRENLSTSAQFLAKSLAYEIDLRWRILEAEANSPELRRLVEQVNESSKDAARWEPVQAWLAQRYLANLDATPCISWFVTVFDGTQIARAPEAPSIGGNYAHRDYFHARGQDFAPGSPEAQNTRPFSDRPVHMSAVYESTNTGTLMVAFSVPIWSGPPERIDRTALGILCMAVELGDFSLADDAILVDTRNDQLEQKPGLVLHHAKLGERTRADLPPRVDPLTLQFIMRLRENEMASQPNDVGPDQRVLEDFRDPVTGEVGLVAVAPALVRGRRRTESDTGWIVIVEESRDEVRDRPQ
jgi:serine/threonine protein kinase